MNEKRHLVLYIATSLDGYIATEDESLEWLFKAEGEGDNGYSEFDETVDTVLMGRKTYDWISKGELPIIKFPKPTVEQFFQTYVISDFTVSDDEQKLIFSSNLNGKMNVWAMDLPDQFPYLFAHQDESAHFLKFDPNNRYVLAGFDNEGDENVQIYAVPPEGGLPQPFITDKPSEKYLLTELSEDGERIYYMTSKENPSFFNTHVRELATGKDTLLNIGEGSPTTLSAVSPNEKNLFIHASSQIHMSRDM